MESAMKLTLLLSLNDGQKMLFHILIWVTRIKVRLISWINVTSSLINHVIDSQIIMIYLARVLGGVNGI